MIKHQIEALADAGVTDIVLAVNYRPEIMEAHLKEVSTMSFIEFHHSVLSTPPGPPPQEVLCNLPNLLLLGYFADLWLGHV